MHATTKASTSGNAVDSSTNTDAWRLARSRCAVAFPNNDPDRFLATCAAIPGAEPVVAPLSADTDQPAFFIAREASRRARLRIGPFSIPGPRRRNADIVRGGIICDDRQIETILDTGLEALWSRDADAATFHAVPLGTALHEHLSKRPRAVERDQQTRYWLRWNPDDDNPLAHRSSKTRSKLRRYRRKFDEAFNGDTEYQTLTQPEDVPRFCAACDAISKQTYHEAIGYGVRDTPLWHDALAAAARSGHWRAYLLLVKGEPVAYQNGSLIDHVYYSDGKGFDRNYDEHRVGTVLLLHVAEDLFQHRATAIDFGPGHSQYKDVFSNHQQNESRFVVNKPGLIGWTDRTAASAASAAERVARKLSATPAGRALRKRLFGLENQSD